MAEKPENPECITGPPIGFISVKDTGGVRSYPLPFTKAGKCLLGDVVADQVILKIGPSIDMNRRRDMAGIIEEHILVALYDSQAGVVKVGGDPFRAHQRFGVGIVIEFVSHRNRL